MTDNVPPIRRMRSFPLTFIITKPTKTHPGSGRGYDPQELAEYQAAQAAEAARRNDCADFDNDAPTSPEPSELDSSGAGQTLRDSCLPVPPGSGDAAPGSSPAILGGRTLTSDDPAASPSGDLTSEASSSGGRSFSSGVTAPSLQGVLTPEATALRETRNTADSDPPDLARHARKCRVCSHPHRDLIEGDFVRWRSPELIAKEHQLPDRVSIYRHAHATGLFRRRKRELGRVLENILESVDHAGFDAAEVIIRAARVYAHLDDEGRWFEPARINYILTGPAWPSEALSAAAGPLPSEAPGVERRPWPAGARSAEAANRNSPELEIEPTP